jgi:hypothetical protein
VLAARRLPTAARPPRERWSPRPPLLHAPGTVAGRTPAAHGPLGSRRAAPAGASRGRSGDVGLRHVEPPFVIGGHRFLSGRSYEGNSSHQPHLPRRTIARGPHMASGLRKPRWGELDLNQRRAEYESARRCKSLACGNARTSNPMCASGSSALKDLSHRSMLEPRQSQADPGGNDSMMKASWANAAA